MTNVLGIFDEAEEDQEMNNDLDDFSLSSSKGRGSSIKGLNSTASTVSDPPSSDEDEPGQDNNKQRLKSLGGQEQEAWEVGADKAAQEQAVPAEKRKLARVKRGAKGAPKPVDVIEEVPVIVLEDIEEHLTEEEEVVETHDTLAAARLRARAAMVRARKENALRQADILSRRESHIETDLPDLETASVVSGSTLSVADSGSVSGISVASSTENFRTKIRENKLISQRLQVSLRVYFFILFPSYVMWSDALGSSGILLSYSIISQA